MDQNTDSQLQHIKGVVEALLFVNEKPITLEQIRNVFDTVSANEIKKAIESLTEFYEPRGVNIVEIAGGYQMLSNSMYAGYIREFYKTKHKDRLSKPALECLAIISYKQPVTRADIELIRGVNSDGVVSHLEEKELIKAVGRKDVPGRPFLYGTTKQFLEYFGLKSINDLPKLEEFPALAPETTDGEPIIDELTGQPMNSMEIAKQQAIREAEVLRQQEEAAHPELEQTNSLDDLSDDESEEGYDEQLDPDEVISEDLPDVRLKEFVPENKIEDIENSEEHANPTISKAQEFLKESEDTEKNNELN